MPKPIKHSKKTSTHRRVARSSKKPRATKPSPAKGPAVAEQEMPADAEQEGVPVFFEEVAFVEEPEIIGVVEL